MVTGTWIASLPRPPGRPRVPAGLASAHFASLQFRSISFAKPLDVLSARFELRISSLVISERPDDRSLASVCGAPESPSRIDDERHSRFLVSCRSTADDGLWQPASKRYLPLRSAESSEARTLPATTLTAALGPFFRDELLQTFDFLPQIVHSGRVRQRHIRV